ncbi:MAG: hypothetical protein U0939_18820 [Pirellulales bacterium]
MMAKPILLGVLAFALAASWFPDVSSPAVCAAEYTPEQQQALAEIRETLASRVFDALSEKVARAKALSQDEEYAQEAARLELLSTYVKEFWDAVDQGAKKAVAKGEIMVDEEPVAVVEYEQQVLIIRHQGQNRRYTRAMLPAKLALVLAQQHLRADAAANRVFTGAFLAMDGKGDRRLAAQHWEQASQGGVDVAVLLPELQAPRAAPLITPPELNPLQRAALAPAQWFRLTKNGARWERQPLGKQGRQNDEGRLLIEASDEDEAVVVFKNRFTGDFQCRVYVQGATAGQQFGLFSGVASDAPVTATLPAGAPPEGTVKIEFQRKAGVYSCRINEEEVAVTPAAKSAARLAGQLGLTLAPGRPAVIAAFEFAGR